MNEISYAVDHAMSKYGKHLVNLWIIVTMSIKNKH